MKQRIQGIAFSSLLVVIGFFSGVWATQTGWVSPVSAVLAAEEQATELTILLEAWGLIEERFIDQEKLDPTRLSYAAINAIIAELGDTGHTRFLSPDQAQQHENSMDGHFFGIGARLGENEAGEPVIIDPFIGSPAEAAGILAQDKLLAVDGENVVAWTVEEIVERIRGEAGTIVTLTVIHPGETAPVSVAIVRGEIVVPSLSWTMIPGSNIAHIHLTQFSANAQTEMAQAIEAAQAEGATGLIIDVRSNPGGLLQQAIEVSSLFLAEGNVLQEADYQGTRREFPVRADGLAQEIPMVVLVNQGSASSSEIFAGAIQDHNRGHVIGTKTFGTGTVLTPFTLSDGSLLLLGTSEWLTAAGRSIRNRGITPDFAVELPMGGQALSPIFIQQLDSDAFRQSSDTQLIKAVDVLQGCWSRSHCRQVGGIR